MITSLLFSLHLSLHFHGVSYPQVGIRTENRQWIKAQFHKKKRIIFCYVVFCKCVYSQELLEMKHRSSGKKTLTFVYVGMLVSMYIYTHMYVCMCVHFYCKQTTIVCTYHRHFRWRSNLWPAPFLDRLQILPPWEITTATTSNIFFQLVSGRKWDILLC